MKLDETSQESNINSKYYTSTVQYIHVKKALVIIHSNKKTTLMS